MSQAPHTTSAPPYTAPAIPMNTYVGDGNQMQWQPQTQQYQSPQQVIEPVKFPTESHQNNTQVEQSKEVVALSNIGRTAAPVACPRCHQRHMTQTTLHSGNTTHAWALGVCCLTGCLCFIPYLMDSLKDVEHRCGNCGQFLATWHKSGSVDVHSYA